MSNNSTSRYVQITPYCLLEILYTSPVTPDTFDYDFIRINNQAMSYIHIMNTDDADEDTRNVRERSAVQITGGKYVDTDKDQVPNYLDYNTQMVQTTVTGVNVPYDECRFHLLAGYNFDDLDGVIFQIDAPERSGKKLLLSNTVFLKDSDFFEYNSRPILLGDRLYDRYVRVRVPSVKLINDIFYSLEGNPAQASTFAAKISSDGMAFMRANPLHISAIEIKSTDVLAIGSAEYKQYNTGATARVSLNQADEFALFGATIQPSAGGDYFEYFATWAGGFIEDYIDAVNGLNGFNYVVIHELRISEQIGSLFTQTAYFQSIQETDFDKPNLFRPIVINASNAVSFTIEYTVRLYNKADSSQIIRVASYTSFDPKMWGKSLTKIKLVSEPESFHVYNRVVSGPTLPLTTFINNTQQVQPYTTRVVPAFFESSLVSIQQDTVYLDQNGQMQSQNSPTSKTVFGQGDATITIAPFDNYFKFTILKTEATTGNTPVPLDLGMTAEYYLVFTNNEGKKVRYKSVTDAQIGNPQSGDLVFKILSADSENVLQFTNKQFWVVSRFVDTGAETGIYHGEFVSIGEMDVKRERDAAAEQRANDRSQLEQRIAELEKKLAEAQSLSVSSGAQLTTINANQTGNNVTQSGVIIPAGVSAQTLNELGAQIPGLNNTVPSAQSSVVASIKPKALTTIPKASKTTEINQSDAAKQ